MTHEERIIKLDELKSDYEKTVEYLNKLLDVKELATTGINFKIVFSDESGTYAHDYIDSGLDSELAEKILKTFPLQPYIDVAKKELADLEAKIDKI